VVADTQTQKLRIEADTTSNFSVNLRWIPQQSKIWVALLKVASHLEALEMPTVSSKQDKMSMSQISANLALGKPATQCMLETIIRDAFVILGEVEKQTVHKSVVVQTMAEATTAVTTAEMTVEAMAETTAETMVETMEVVMMVTNLLMELHLLIWWQHYKLSRTTLTTVRKRRAAPPINWISHSITLN